MKLLLRILVFLLLQNSIVYLLYGQSDCQKQINDLQFKKNKLTTEKNVALSQLKQGKYCSQCSRSAIEIEKTGVNFKQHLMDVHGKEIPASSEVIKQKAEEYNRQIKDLGDQILTIKLNCNQNSITSDLDNDATQNNSDNPVDNTYNPFSPVDNTFNDGQNNTNQKETTELPEDLLEKLNGKSANNEKIETSDTNKSNELPEYLLDSTIKENINISHHVKLFPQPNSMSCWSAAATMLFGDRSVGNGNANIDSDGFLMADKENIEKFAKSQGLKMYNQSPSSVNELASLLRVGPLWVAGAVPLGHAYVIAAMKGDGTPKGTKITIYDPWPPNKGEIREEVYETFINKYPNAFKFILYR